ncbi:tRNA 2-thiouridine(34) synthase MnmA [Desulforhopalus vacuolatus]|nr:tRNA 2-thiouridine(34) synthase MnmA [Desulforhopalus vacuolatus]
MSGGVDSTATALILKEKYGAENLRGFFMRLAQPDFEQQLARVQEVAERVGIELHVIDLSAAFEENVVSYFADSYFSGRTPNPCVICNLKIKFGLFLDAMVAAGMDTVATGHYARLLHGTSCRLLMGVDQRKDQSYFLARLSQQQLGRVLFPLGEMAKDDIYDFVEAHGFTDFRGKESQDICFLENTSVSAFLEDRRNIAVSGAIVDTEGNELGRHAGVHRYTIGQRRGLGIASSAPLYVIALDMKKNEVIVGRDTDLLCSEIELTEIQWFNGEVPVEGEYLTKIRYTHRGAPARLTLEENNCGRLHFSEPQRAVTPGQFAVFYSEEEVIGSGVIQ